MSTLGRKAIKKTIERLRKTAINRADIYLTHTKKIVESNEPMPKRAVDNIIFTSADVIVNLLQYIMALEDYRQELDDAWEKLLKSAKKTKSVKKKDEGKKKEGKKPFYVK